MGLYDARLQEIVSSIIIPMGYLPGEIKFLASKDFKFSWSIRGKTVNFSVSDYIDDAPEIVLRQFVQGAIDFAFKKKPDYGNDFLAYVRSDEFILHKRPDFYRRTKRLTRSDIGVHRNLFDSVQRLMDMGLLTPEDIDNTVFSWSTGSNYARLGYCSQMFRIVMISSIFDDPDVDEEMLDYVVYHECMHLRQGYRPFDHNPHDAQFHRMMDLFPNGAQIEKKLPYIRKRI